MKNGSNVIILMHSSEIWYMYFYEKILKGQLGANKSNSNFDFIDSLDTSFLEKVNLKFGKFVLEISKKSVNIAARAKLSQYPLDVYLKLQVLKYMARISNKDNNPLLMDAYSLSKTLHLNGAHSWYTFAKNILNTNEITEQNIEVTDFNKEKWHLTKSLKTFSIQQNKDKLYYRTFY